MFRGAVFSGHGVVGRFYLCLLQFCPDSPNEKIIQLILISAFSDKLTYFLLLLILVILCQSDK